MDKRVKGYIISLLLLLMLPGCDGGLAPYQKSYIKGLITYSGGSQNWPPKDSVFEIRVVAFKKYPPKDILSEITNNQAYFTETLPLFADTSGFKIEIPRPCRIEYIVVALRYGINFFNDWRAVGLYCTIGNRNNPTAINVTDGVLLENLNITVDFKDLPPQPFQMK